MDSNLENMDTSMIKAPVSGIPLFQMSAVILIPPVKTDQNWQMRLKSVSEEQNVDILIKPFKG